MSFHVGDAAGWFFVLSDRVVIKTGAAYIVWLWHLRDWYCVNVRGKFPRHPKIKEMENENQDPLWLGTLAEQHRAAICLWSDLSGKAFLHPAIFLLFFVFWIRFFLFLFYWSVNLVVQCSLSEQLRGMTLRRMIERHLSERDIKSNKDLSWLRAQRVSREKVRLIWTEEQQREATVNVSLWQDREKAVRGQLLAQFLNICFDTTV